MKAPVTLVRAEDLTEGAELMFLNRPHRVIRIDPYDGAHTELGAFAIARWVDSLGNEAGMTLFKGDRLEVLA